MLCALSSFRKPTPSWANSFAHTGVSPNPFGSVTTRHQTPDNWQAAIIRKLRQSWASPGWTCRHLHFRMTRIRKDGLCEARLRKAQYVRQLNHYRRAGAPPRLGSHTRVSCALKKTKKKFKKSKITRPDTNCGLNKRYGRPIAICMALCTDDLPIRGKNLHDLNGSKRYGCGAAHVLLKLRWKGKFLSFSKYPTFEIRRGGVHIDTD